MEQTISSSNVTGEYSSEDMHSFQLTDNCVGPILKANQKPSLDVAKGQSVEYRRLL